MARKSKKIDIAEAKRKVAEQLEIAVNTTRLITKGEAKLLQTAADFATFDGIMDIYYSLRGLGETNALHSKIIQADMLAERALWRYAKTFAVNTKAFEEMSFSAAKNFAKVLTPEDKWSKFSRAIKHLSDARNCVAHELEPEVEPHILEFFSELNIQPKTDFENFDDAVYALNRIISDLTIERRADRFYIELDPVLVAAELEQPTEEAGQA